jgi:hypothetical protein
MSLELLGIGVTVVMLGLWAWRYYAVRQYREHFASASMRVPAKDDLTLR